jgi:hypothetical protein
MKKFNNLTDTQVAEMIAEEMGWKIQFAVGAYPAQIYLNAEGYPNYYSRLESGHIAFKKWNPIRSLDQCAVFEEWLRSQEDQGGYFKETIFKEYCEELEVCATPRQRCEAFLKTMGRVE